MALKIMSEGVGIRSTARILELDVNTVQEWLMKGSEHMEAISHYMIHELHIPQVQVDEMWAILGKRDELAPQKRNNRWVWSAIDPQSKLLLVLQTSQQSASAIAHANPNEGQWFAKAVGTENSSYGSWHHRPHLHNGGIAYVSCSTISSASSEENSCTADSWSCIADSWSIALSLSHGRKKCAFDAEMKRVDCRIAR